MHEVVGQPRPIRDAALKVSGRKPYVADLRLPGMLHAALVLSPHAHARVRAIDASAAKAAPGVHAVVTYEDAPRRAYNGAARMVDLPARADELVLTGEPLFVGDAVAAVAAETEEQARAAAKLVRVEYEELPAVLSIDEALAPGAPLVHPDMPGNVVCTMQAGDAEATEAALAAASHVVEGTFTTPPIHQAAIECHVAVADWDPMGDLTLWCPSQNSYATRLIVSQTFGLPESRVRVVAPGIGGAFGGKLEVTIEPIAVLLSRACGRPVRLELNRREDIMATRVRHGSWCRVRLGYGDDGVISAMDFQMRTNTGAYTGSATNVGGALMHKVMMAYRAPYVHVSSTPVYTNTVTAGAMRGYGSPQIYFGFQRLVNRIARERGLDVAEVQRRNMVEPDACLPWGGGALGNPRPLDCLARVRKLVGWDEALAEQEASRARGGDVAVGVGLALGVHGNNCYGVHRDCTTPVLTMTEDGSAILHTGAHEMGQDTTGSQASIVSEVLGLPLERVGVVSGDTDATMWHIGDYSSRGAFVVCAAAKRVAELMAAELRAAAGRMLGVASDEVGLGGGCARVLADPARSLSLAEVCTHVQAHEHRELAVSVTYDAPRSAASYGVHAAVVEVSRSTGKVRVRRYAAVHDVGFVLNPLAIEGQLQGGVHMGLGYALSEGITFDAKGAPKQLKLGRVGLRRATEMPDELVCDFVCADGGEPGGPWGAKALGECPVVPVAPCVVNAICNALDVEIDDLPATPERVLAAVERARAGDVKSGGASSSGVPSGRGE